MLSEQEKRQQTVCWGIANCGTAGNKFMHEICDKEGKRKGEECKIVEETR